MPPPRPAAARGAVGWNVVIGLLTLDIHLPYAASLKDRRAVVRGLKDRLRTGFNVAVAEIGDVEHWQRATVAVVSVSADRVYLEGLLRRAADAAVSLLAGQQVDVGEIEILEG